MAYSGIFRTGDIFIQLQAHYSDIIREQSVHILNFIQADSGIFGTVLFRHVMFHAYAGTFGTLEYVIKQSFMQNKKLSNLEPKMSCLCNFEL